MASLWKAYKNLVGSLPWRSTSPSLPSVRTSTWCITNSWQCLEQGKGQGQPHHLLKQLWWMSRLSGERRRSAKWREQDNYFWQVCNMWATNKSVSIWNLCVVAKILDTSKKQTMNIDPSQKVCNKLVLRKHAANQQKAIFLLRTLFISGFCSICSMLLKLQTSNKPPTS